MKDFWNKLQRWWLLAALVQRALLGAEIIFISLIFWTLLTVPAEDAEKSTPASEEIVGQESTELRFPPNDFNAAKLAAKYELGTWDGSLVRSTDGKNVASIDEHGYLWLNCQRYQKLVDVIPDEYMHYDTIYLKSAAINVTALAGDITRYDWTSKDPHLEIILENVVSSHAVKVAADSARFILYEYDEDGNLATCRLMEIHSTGPVVEICSAPHSLNIRALSDYPKEGNMAEFWLLRHAYTKGAWNGEPKSIGEIAELMDLDLTKAPAQKVHNYRDPDLDELDFTSLNPESIADVDYKHIVVDNVEKYYLHATRPFLADDIAYRKIKAVSNYGFAEIDNLARHNYWDENGIPEYESPVYRFSVAMRPEEYSGSTYDPTTVAITLPYFDKLSENRGEMAPAYFVDCLEIINVVNCDNGLRAALIGHYDSPNANNPEATFTAYLSRGNSLFSAVISGMHSGFFMPQVSGDSLKNGITSRVPRYEYVSLYLYNYDRTAVMEDIFMYDNTLQVFSNSEKLDSEQAP